MPRPNCYLHWPVRHSWTKSAEHTLIRQTAAVVSKGPERCGRYCSVPSDLYEEFRKLRVGLDPATQRGDKLPVLPNGPKHPVLPFGTCLLPLSRLGNGKTTWKNQKKFHLITKKVFFLIRYPKKHTYSCTPPRTHAALSSDVILKTMAVECRDSKIWNLEGFFQRQPELIPGIETGVACVAGEHSSKELFESLMLLLFGTSTAPTKFV